MKSCGDRQPRAEILSIGTELLLGQILDTNSQYLTRALAGIGVDCLWHTTVGDNKSRIEDCLRIALERADVILTTGGLGPTADDLTRECLAEFFSVPLLFDQSVATAIAERFAQRQIAMPESNRKQALCPHGACLIPNSCGTAPGIIWKVETELLEQASISQAQGPRYLITFPGVPTEMIAMWQESAKEFLVDTFGRAAIWSCDLKHYGISESALAEMYAQLLGLSNPTVAPLAGGGECRLRVTAKAESIDEAKTIASPVIDQIRKKSGYLCYGCDDDTLEAVVGALLTNKSLTLAVAESCTGGLVSKRLTDIPGSSLYIKLNVVTYADLAKEKILGVSPDILVNCGTVSSDCAQAMAYGIAKLAGSDIGLSITGIAGPGGGSASKPVGLVYVALFAEHFQRVQELCLPPDLPRCEIRQRTANAALNMVRLCLLDDSGVATNG